MKAKRLLFILSALLAAGLACGLPSQNGQNIPATVNAISTSVQQTLDAQSGSPQPATPVPEFTLDPSPSAVIATQIAPTLGVIPPTSAPAATPADRPNGTPLHALHRSTAPQIDGEFNDWPELPYTFNQPVYRPENWTGLGDTSANFALGWDAANLYLAVQVVDDVYVQTQTGELIFRGDSLEILLDADLSGDFADQRLSADDFQLGLTPGEQKTGGPEAYLWFPASRAGRRDVTVSAHQDETGQGFYLEAAIPWSVFNLAPSAGDRFGFALSVSDNDTPGTAEQQSMISTVATRRLSDPTTWGTLVLDQ